MIFFRGDVGKQRLQTRLFHLLAEHRVELTVNQHLNDWLACGRALGRVDVLRDMRVLERHPLHRIEVDAMLIGQDAAQPRTRSGGERADADPPALEIARLQVAEIGPVDRVGILMPRYHHARQQHHRLAETSRHQIGDDRHLRDVEGLFAHHRLEALVGRRVFSEIERNEIRSERSILQR